MEMIKDRCQEGFSRALEAYLRKETILQFISQEKDILDVGCGWAVLSAYLANKGYKVSAIDNSQEILNFAWETISRYKAPVNIKLCGAEKLDFSDASFDLVIYEEMLEHLKQPLLALQEGRRVLRANGKIILSVPNLKSPRMQIAKWLGLKELIFNPEHKYDFDYYSISKLVNQADFRIISLTSDFIHIPKLPLGLFLNVKKALARRFPSLGQHLIIYAQKLDTKNNE
jgi:2-polyprenyl-3-methyl-5-hydroxy-6-metoxy-1,4-benzoquinol methylase